MSWALRAWILITLDAHAGTWCTLAWLAGEVVVPMHALRPLCEALAAEGLVQTMPYCHEPVFGVQITVEFAGVNDVHAVCLP